jgi:cytidyltransferase-like protein
MEDDTTSVSVLLGIAAGLLGLFWSVILAPHIYRILRPSIVAYPWDEGSKSNDNNTKEETNKKNNQTVVFAASYNPPHRGHLRMLEYLSKKYDRVIAVVGFNPDKKYPVSPEERAGLLREMLKSRTENVTVEGEWWQCLCLACVWFLLCLIVWKIVDLARGYPLWNTSSSCPITTVVSKYIVFHRARSFGGSFLPSFLPLSNQRFFSGGRLHMAVLQACSCDALLSRDPELGEGWGGRAIPADPQHLGPPGVRTTSDSYTHHLHRGRPEVQPRVINADPEHL